MANAIPGRYGKGSYDPIDSFSDQTNQLHHPVQNQESISQRAINHFTHTGKYLVTVPFRAGTMGAKAISKLSFRPVVAPISALGWAVFGMASTTCKGFSQLLNTASSGEMTNIVVNEYQHLTHERINAAKESLGHSWTNYVPILSTITQIEQQALSHNTAAAQKHLQVGFSALRRALPYLLGAMGKTFSTADEAMSWAQSQCYHLVKNPSEFSLYFDMIANQAESCTAKIMHQYKHADLSEFKDISVISHNKYNKPICSDQKLTQFLDLDKEQQENILYLTSYAWDLDETEKSNYTLALKQAQQGNLSDASSLKLKELVAMYGELNDQEKQKITPSDFRSLDELDKIKFLRIVQENTKSLSSEERKFLVKFRALRHRGDWNALSTEKQQAIEKIILPKFNQLQQKKQKELFKFSIEQFQDLTLEDQTALIHYIKERAQQLNSLDPKKQEFLDRIAKNPSLILVKEIRSLLRIIDKHLPLEEKAQLFNSMQSRLTVLELDPQQFEQLIQETRQELEQLQKNALTKNSPAAQSLKAYLNVLITHKENKEMVGTEGEIEEIPPSLQDNSSSEPLIISASKPIDLDKIEEKIGIHIVSQGVIRSAAHYFGYIPELGIKGQAYLIGKLCDLTGLITRPRWIEGILSGVAHVAELSNLLPFIQETLYETAAEYVDIYQWERNLNSLPATTLKALVDAEGATIHWIKQAIESGKSALNFFPTLLQNIEQANQLPSIQLNTEKLRSHLEKGIHDFSGEVSAFCQAASNRESLFVCTPQVLGVIGNAANLEAYAQAQNLELNSPQFLNLLSEGLITGKLPGTNISIDENTPLSPGLIDSVVNTVTGNMITQGVSSGWGYFSHAADASYSYLKGLASPTFEWAKQSSLGKAAALTGSAAMDLGGQSVVNGIKNIAQESTAGIQNVLSSGADFGQKLFNLKQEIPSELQGILTQLKTTAENLAQNEEKITAYQASTKALKECSSSFGFILEYLAKNEKFAATTQLLQKEVLPKMEAASQALLTAQKIADANSQVLQYTIDRSLNLEVSADELRVKMHKMAEEQGKIAAQNLEDRDNWSSHTKKVTSNALLLGSYGISAYKFLLTSGQAVSIIPFVMTKILPHVLRSMVPHAKQVPALWYSLGAQAVSVGNQSGNAVHGLITDCGSYLQRMYNTSLSYYSNSVYIDPQRVKNFYQLSFEEKNHLFSIVSSSSSWEPHQQEKFQNLLNRFPQKITQQELDQLVEITLHAFDRMENHEKLRISPEYYYGLDSRTQHRLQDIVFEHIPISKLDKKDPLFLIQLFNQLPLDVRRKIDEVSVYEYAQLSDADQDDIHFILAHTKSCRDFLEETKEEGTTESDSSFSTSSTEESEDSIETQPLSQQGAYQKIKKANNKELKLLLGIYSHLSLEERSMWTPSRLSKLSLCKLLHLYDIAMGQAASKILNVHKQTGIDISTREKLERILQSQSEMKTVEKQKKIVIEQLAFIFNGLNTVEKAQFITMPADEFWSYSPQKQQEVLAFLLDKFKTTHHQAIIQNFILQLAQRNTLSKADSKQVVKLFNNLSRGKQIEFREMQESATQQTQAIEENFALEKERLQKELEILKRRIEQLSQIDIPGIQFNISNLNQQIAQADASKQPQIKKNLTKQTEAFDTSARRLLALEKHRDHLLEQLYHVQKLAGEQNTLHFDSEQIIEAESPQIQKTITEAIQMTLASASKDYLDSYCTALNIILERHGLGQETFGYIEGLLLAHEELERVAYKQQEHLKQEINKIHTVIIDEATQPDEKMRLRLDLRHMHNYELPLAQAKVAEYKKIGTSIQEKFGGIIGSYYTHADNRPVPEELLKWNHLLNTNLLSEPESPSPLDNASPNFLLKDRIVSSPPQGKQEPSFWTQLVKTLTYPFVLGARKTLRALRWVSHIPSKIHRSVSDIFRRIFP